MDPRYLSQPVLISYDGEQSADPPAKPAEPTAPSGFVSQEKLNSILADDRRKHQAKIDGLTKLLDDTLAKGNLSEQEKTDYAAKLEEFQARERTAAEQAAHERKQREEAHKKEVAEKNKEAATWKQRFEASTIDRSIRDAAHNSDAYSADQIASLLGPRASVVEKTDERGKGTGEFEVRVAHNDVDDSGNPVTRSLTPAETLKTMQQHPERFGNLFKSGVVSGIGSNSGVPTGSNGKFDVRKLTQAQYMEIREKNPELLGLRNPKNGKFGR